MEMDPIINGGIAFAAVLILMVLNIPIGIAMLLVGFTGFALISGFDPAIFVLVLHHLMRYRNILYQYFHFLF